LYIRMQLEADDGSTPRGSVHRLAFPTGGSLLAALPLRVPDALRKQAIEVGEVTVTIDEEPEAFAVRLPGPLAGPRFAARVVRVEPDAPQCLPAAMRTALHIAPVLVLPTERHAAVGTGVAFHRRDASLYAAWPR
jgi:hypothetical protein